MNFFSVVGNKVIKQNLQNRFISVNKLITFFLNESHEKGMVSHWKGYHAD